MKTRDAKTWAGRSPGPWFRGGRGARTNGDVGEELLYLDDGDAAPRTGGAVAHDNDRMPAVFRRPGGGRVMPDQVADRIIANADRLDDCVIEAPIHGAGDGVDRAAAERVVRMRLEQRTPGGNEEGESRRRAASPSERRPRFGVANEEPFRQCVVPLLRCSRCEGALQRPGKTVRVAELAFDPGQLARQCSGEQILGENRQRAGADRVAAFGRRIDERSHRLALLRLTRMVIGTVRHEEDAGFGAGGELRPHSRPPIARGLHIDGKVGAELVAVRRQVVDDRALAVGGGPLDGIRVRPAAATEAPPEDDQRKREACRNDRKGGRVAERIRTVEDRLRRRTESSQHASAQQQIPDQRLAAWYQLVGEDVPGPGLDRPALEEASQLRGALGTYVQIVLEDDRLPVEEKALVRPWWVGEQLIDERDEPLPKTDERLVPLAIPVRVGDDVGGEHEGREGGQLRETKRPRRRSPRPPGRRKYSALRAQTTGRLPVTRR